MESVTNLCRDSLISSRAASYGIYTLLDMHQDVFNARFCGEGLPDWAIRTGSKQHDGCSMFYD